MFEIELRLIEVLFSTEPATHHIYLARFDGLQEADSIDTPAEKDGAA